MATIGHNQGFRVLDEFVCDAIGRSDMDTTGVRGRGINPGMQVVAERTVGDTLSAVPENRLTELRKMSSAELLAIIRSTGPSLNNAELVAIHDIAAERLSNGPGPVASEELDLSRAAMLAAVERTTA
jgi:hypothetical protein